MAEAEVVFRMTVDLDLDEEQEIEESVVREELITVLEGETIKSGFGRSAVIDNVILDPA